jgi:hypothetical protein
MCHCNQGNSDLSPAAQAALAHVRALPGMATAPPFMQCVTQAIIKCLATPPPPAVAAQWYPGCIILEALKCLTGQ